jgi:SAM-dependent methyltransferase
MLIAADPSNQAAIEHWNGPWTRRWVTEQARLDRVFDQLDDVALVHAAPQPGEHVVDVGCGCGASSLRCAELVGPHGSVLGLDVSGMMLQRARERAQSRPQITFRNADAAAYPFRGDADLVYSRLGVMFFGAPDSAFTNLRRALRPGGRLYAVCWRSPDENAWYTVPLRAAARHVALPAPPPAHSPGPFSLADSERFAGILRAAGFSDIRLQAHDIPLRLTTEGVDDAVAFAMQAGPLARILSDSGLDPNGVAQVRAAVRETLAEHESGGTVALGAAFWLATARA